MRPPAEQPIPNRDVSTLLALAFQPLFGVLLRVEPPIFSGFPRNDTSPCS